jgi:signal transduction histidine kinase
VCHALYPIRTGPSVTSPSRDPGTALPSEPDGPRRPDILVRSEQRAGWAGIHGCDRGIGLPATQLDRFFEPFVRLHAADVYPGTGIRFAFVLAHGGRSKEWAGAWERSPSSGQGAISGSSCAR